MNGTIIAAFVDLFRCSLQVFYGKMHVDVAADLEKLLQSRINSPEITEIVV